VTTTMRPEAAVFDFRVRLGPGADALTRLLSTMDECGIARAAVTAGGMLPLDRLAAQIIRGGHSDVVADNARVQAASAASGGRLVPIYFVNPRSGVADYRDAAAGFAGVELSPAVHGVGLDDARTAAVVRIAEQAGHSVYVVTLGRQGSRTADLVALARTFPVVTFVLGHGGFLGIDTDAIAQVVAVPNILVETSGCFTEVARVALDRLGPHRLLFGSEFPLQHPSVELAKYRCLNLPPADWARVAWHNAIRVLGSHT